LTAIEAKGHGSKILMKSYVDVEIAPNPVVPDTVIVITGELAAFDTSDDKSMKFKFPFPAMLVVIKPVSEPAGL
jgi:hypothetical protein